MLIADRICVDGSGMAFEEIKRGTNRCEDARECGLRHDECDEWP